MEAVPGNSILLRPDTSQIDLDYLKAQIREHQIDAVLVSRLVKVDKDVTYIPGQNYIIPYGYYHTFYGYYGAVYQQVYSPDYLREDTTVRIETNLYATTPPDGEPSGQGAATHSTPSRRIRSSTRWSSWW